MFESSMQVTITDYAMKRTGKLHGKDASASQLRWITELTTFAPSAEHEPKMWDNLKGQFMNHLDQVNADLKAAGLPPLGTTN